MTVEKELADHGRPQPCAGCGDVDAPVAWRSLRVCRRCLAELAGKHRVLEAFRDGLARVAEPKPRMR